MQSKLNLGIALSLVVAVGLVVVLLVAVKPAAKVTANEWKRTEGEKLLAEKREVKQADFQGRFLLEAAFRAKEAGPDSSAVLRSLLKSLSSDTTGLKATASGQTVRYGWSDREIVVVFAQGKLKEIDLSALTGATEGGQ